MSTFLAIMTSVLAVCVAIMLVIFLFVPIFKGLSWFVRHIFAFIAGMLQSALRLVGGVLTAVVLVPLILINVVIGRWSAAGHFGRSLQDEGRAMGSALYRLVVGHPARLFMLTPLVEGIEQRVPQAVAHAPTNDKPNKRAVGQFEGYSIVGSLKAGGSGGKLYVANPDAVKRAAFERQGLIVDQVVIKVFSLADGSSLPQIVRESKSLDAAKRLGLILDHDLTEKRFFYVMPYVPGDTLSVVTNQLHDRAGPAGLSGETLRDALSYLSDLVRTLEQYHRGGLWHKDVKPDNIIVSSGRAHLVDFGLITPLRSAMTLTTHGTEYFRDPEMVRLALKGVKVHEVDGAKFDIYACGAVLYSVIERSFPAHGGLSQITRKCPEAVRWIIRRSMADYDSRYASTRSLLDDLTYVLDAADPFAVKPADLPSMRGGDARTHDETHEVAAHAAAEEARAVRDAAARSPIPPRVNAPRPADAPAAARSPGQRPRIRVTDWLRGGYVVEGGANPAGASGFDPAQSFGAARAAAAGARRSAQEQLDNARARVAARRGRVSARFNGRPIPRPTRFDTRPNAGVAIAFFVFIGLCVLGVSLIVHAARKPGAITIVDSEGGARISDGLSTMDNAFSKALAGMDNDFRKAFSDMGQGFKDAFTGVGEAREGVAAAVEAGKRAAAEGVRAGFIASADAAQTVADSHREQASALREKASDIAAGGGRNAARDSRRLLAQADALDKRADSESNRAADMRAKADQASSAANSIPAPNIGGRWLVIDDFPAATSDPAVRSRINNAITVLRGANCELVGLADDPADLELLAAARKSLGVALPTDPAAAERLRGWLASSGENFRGVVWFGKTDERSGVRPVVVVRDGDKASDVSRAVSGKNTQPPVPPVPKAGATPPVSPSTPATPSPTP